MNERKTERLVRDLLKSLKYYDSVDSIIVEEQRSDIFEVHKLLKGSSKSGKGGLGSPEFIISTKDTPDFIIIIECKASTSKHESLNHDKPKEYAVDGVLWYARALSRSFNVIAVAVSGQTTAELKVSNFMFPKGATTYKDMQNKSGKIIKKMLSLEDYIESGTYDPDVSRLRHDELMDFSRELHNFMRDHAKLTESEKPLLVSGTLIALKNRAFAKSFDEYEPGDLQREWLRVIKEELKKADIPNSKEESMTQPYSNIAVHPNLGKSTNKFPKGILFELIKRLSEKVWPFISVYHDYDVVGQFYGEFLKYTGGDKKGLGIVLTPRHITELFALLANVQKNSRILDICAGTGGFLISAMYQMMKQTTSNADKDKIKRNGLVGVEDQPHMYALAASNMILRGDGKANLYKGSCFDEEITKALIQHKCDIGMLNPPYSQKDEESKELAFVAHMLSCLKKGGIGIAIVPISCATTPSNDKETLLKNHTLLGVMSMPNELFSPTGTVTCIMVFKAKVPHEESKIKTWFGYWKDDGFVKSKNKGRLDQNNTWSTIRDHWVETFRNQDSIPGECVKQYVTAKDEWVAEAYMETDYSVVTEEVFEETIKNYIIYKIKTGLL